MGSGVMGYLQQLLPSQQAGFPQQAATTVAAPADSVKTRTAANANAIAIALSFIKSPLKMLLDRHACLVYIDTHSLEAERRCSKCGDRL